MKRFFLMLTTTVMLTAMVAFAGPAFAQGGHTSCKAFGQNVAGRSTTYGVGFGQPAAASTPLNDIVEDELSAFW